MITEAPTHQLKFTHDIWMPAGHHRNSLSELPPRGVLPPVRLAFDEVVHHFHQFSNTHGSRPARLLHYNYFPLLLSASPDPEAFISTSRGQAGEPVRSMDLEAMYAEPAPRVGNDTDVVCKRRQQVWVGSFCPDMRAWSTLTANQDRGAGGRRWRWSFPARRSVATCRCFRHAPTSRRTAMDLAGPSSSRRARATR